MRVADGVEMLELESTVMGRMQVYHPTLLWDDRDVILVDAGVPGLLSLIREAVEKVGVAFDAINRVIVSHQDLDHIGSLPEVLQASPRDIEVLAHEGDRPYIEGEKRLLKWSDENIARMVEGLPADQREQARRSLQSVAENPPKARVDRTLADGERLPYCGGITVIHTPGHTPGHLCLYHHASRTLVAGDAMVVSDGRLMGPNPQATPDLETARQSLRKLVAYDIDAVICYHGSLYRGDANQRIAELAS